MHKLIAIVVAGAVAAMIGVTVSGGAHMPDAERAPTGMPSILHMMSEAGTLPQTPFVSP